VLTFNGITAYGNGHDSLIGGDELSDAERDERFGEIRGSPMRPGPLRVMRCVAVAQQIPYQRALEVDHIIPRNQGGSDAISNLQAHRLPRRAVQLRPPRSGLCVLRAASPMPIP
jgi:hypothetical protein